MNEMTKEDYELKFKKSEMYNSFWKTVKAKIEDAIKNDNHIVQIELLISEDDSTSFVIEILNMIESSIKSIYNCDNVSYKFTTTSVTLLVKWNEDTVIPYKEKR